MTSGEILLLIFVIYFVGIIIASVLIGFICNSSDDKDEDKSDESYDGIANYAYFSWAAVLAILIYMLICITEGFSKPNIAKIIYNWTRSKFKRRTEKKEVKSDSQDCVTQSSKTEPMFKEGDWIVDTRDGEVFKVDKVLDNTYNVVGLDGFDFNGIHYGFEKNYRIWNPSDDAKDGDVLITSRGCIFIYRKTQYKNALAYFYAGINAYGDVVINDIHHSLQHFGPLNEIHPATDIEAEELFEKMLNYGYEWDEKERKINKVK